MIEETEFEYLGTMQSFETAMLEISFQLKRIGDTLDRVEKQLPNVGRGM